MRTSGDNRRRQIAAEQFRELVGSNRLTEVEALAFGASFALKSEELLARLHALCNDPKTKTLAHIDDRADDTRVIRVGGQVQAANLLRQTRPVYPPLAKAARVQGTVKFEATIGKDGTIQNLHLISGPPLLVQAAQQAVAQWQYKPTLLNGEPVEVLTTIDVNFTLSQ